MTIYGIRIHAENGGWLSEFDPDYHPPGRPFPTGSVTATLDPKRALTFAEKEDAFTFWQTPSTVCPTRPDGRPNRPLTAFTVSIEPLPIEEGT